MLMTEATPEMVEEWKRIWVEYRDKLKPNRKTGKEIIDYLTSQYSMTEIFDQEYLNVVSENVLNSEHYLEKLQANTSPSPRAFIINNSGAGQTLYKNQDEIFNESDIFAGIDLSSGCYFVEGSSLLWDELCAFQGLDERDIENYFCVAQYIYNLKKHGLLDDVINSND